MYWQKSDKSIIGYATLMLLSYNVLDTKGKGVGGYPASHGGDFLK